MIIFFNPKSEMQEESWAVRKLLSTVTLSRGKRKEQAFFHLLNHLQIGKSPLLLVPLQEKPQPKLTEAMWTFFGLISLQSPKEDGLRSCPIVSSVTQILPSLILFAFFFTHIILVSFWDQFPLWPWDAHASSTASLIRPLWVWATLRFPGCQHDPFPSLPSDERMSHTSWCLN